MVQAEAGAAKGAVTPAAGEGRELSDELEALNYQLEADEKLTEAQQEQLIDAMYEERKAVAAQYGTDSD